MDAGGEVTNKSFGMSLWKSLAALESWAESHPTHVAIFATADEQFFEYLNCHDRTGMLRAR